MHFNVILMNRLGRIKPLPYKPKFRPTIKANRRKDLQRVRRVEDFLRPYPLNKWRATRWYIEAEDRHKEEQQKKKLLPDS